MKKYLVFLLLALISSDIYSLSGDGKGISLGVGGRHENNAENIDKRFHSDYY